VPLSAPFRLYFEVGGVELGFELGAWRLQNRSSSAGAALPVHFVLVILEMGGYPLKLFAQAGLEPQSSQSQPPK
jgi:hypothetical protein